MNYSEIKDEIDRKIIRKLLPKEVDYAVFIKPNDRESDCLMAFVGANNLSAKVLDVSTVVGSCAMDDYTLMECDTPCICSTEDYQTLYEGCPERMSDLERREEAYPWD